MMSIRNSSNNNNSINANTLTEPLVVLLQQLGPFYKELLQQTQFWVLNAGTLVASAAMTILILNPEIVAAFLPIAFFGSLWYCYKKHAAWLEGTEVIIPEEAEGGGSLVVVGNNDNDDEMPPESEADHEPTVVRRSGPASSDEPPMTTAAMAFLQSDTTAPLSGVMSFLKSSTDTARYVVSNHQPEQEPQPPTAQNQNQNGSNTSMINRRGSSFSMHQPLLVQNGAES